MTPEFIDNTDRGQVGIGTLIIFIALVLVAAVAAGVLVNTSGELQSTAADTGSQAQAEVSNQLDVVSATGETASNGNNVTAIDFEVKKSAGADAIDTGAMTVQFTSDSSSATITSTVDTVLSETSDRATITVDLSSDPSSGTLNELEPGSEAQVTFVDQSGASTIYGVNVPQVTTGKDFVPV